MQPLDGPRVGSLFTGGGGLDMAVHMLWPNALPVWCSEVDKHASALLEARMPTVTNLGDITAIDWHQVEPVDVLVGGFPCQDISHAGKRAGITEETRSGLWFNFRDAIRVLRPRLVLVENVAALASPGGGLDVVLGSLAEVGFDAEWELLRAGDVGAPHRRDRCFIVAWHTDADLAGLEGRDPGGVRERAHERAPGALGTHDLTFLPTPQANLGRGTGTPSYETAYQRQVVQGKRNLDDAVAMLPTPTAMDSRGSRNATAARGPEARPVNTGWTLNDVRHAYRWAEYGQAIARWEAILGRRAPAPTDDRGRLSPLFVEWLMGWPQGWMSLPGLSRSNRLKILGNGVVPQQAAAAFRQLLARAADDLYAAA
jgi:DNA (cytosine-5)-methyltransferase 1